MLRDLELRRTYNTKKNKSDVLSEFFVPVLSEAVSYDRLTFTFTSGALAAAARGIAQLVRNGGSMRILAAPSLTEADQAVVLSATSLERNALFERLAAETIGSIGDLSTRIEKHYVEALAWMLASKRLELRFAFSVDFLGDPEGIFHPKVGIIRDKSGDGISFSGSINETLSAWSKNNENFKVFKSWEEFGSEHFQDDVDSFESYWNHPEENGIQFVDVRDPFEQTLIQTAPAEFPFVPLIRFEEKKPTGDLNTPHIRDYQKEAIGRWEANNHRGILQMATGSGKTFTSACAIKALRESKPGVAVFTIAPNISIARQWSNALKDLNPIGLHETASWKRSLETAINDFLLGIRESLTVISILDRSSSEWFLDQVRRLAKGDAELLLVADEVHNFGAHKRKAALSAHYHFRLGLSATPTRYFDEEGTTFIEEYFDGSVFEFSIQDALNWVPPEGQNPILCPFDYSPVHVDLDSESLQEYVRLTGQVARAHFGSAGQDRPKEGSLAASRRAEILKTAPSKIPALEIELKRRAPIKQAIVYCFGDDQVNAVREICRRLGIKFSIFSQDVGKLAEPRFDGLSEREAVLKDHAGGKIDLLIGMQMLDEGIDLPNARLAFMLSSSGNAKEFVQRTGRVIRWSNNKRQAEIVDFIAQVPFEFETLSKSERRNSAKLMLKETKRMIEYVLPADNKSEVLLPLVASQTKLKKIIRTLEEEE